MYPNRQDTKVVLAWWGWILVIGLIVGATLVVGRFAFGWFTAPVQIYSIENVREQWRFAYDYDESLKAAAQQVCIAEKAVQDASSDNEKSQRRSQQMAYETNYTRIEADFNARLRNAFEAKLVKPADVPDKAPSLSEMKKRVCNK